jgi:hypothetical protein
MTEQTPVENVEGSGRDDRPFVMRDREENDSDFAGMDFRVTPRANPSRIRL